jgi:hypothetical protein
MWEGGDMKRYDFRETDVYLGEYPNGSFVRYDEAHAIEQERDAARKSADYWKAELNAANAEIAALKAELATLQERPK